jgi:hypothetical protein
MTTFEHTTIKVFEGTIKHEIEICSGKNKVKNTIISHQNARIRSLKLHKGLAPK